MKSPGEHSYKSALIGWAAHDVGLCPSCTGWETFRDFHLISFSLNSIKVRQTSTLATSPVFFLLWVSMISSLLLLFGAGLLHHTAGVTHMDKLADNKICGDAECSSKSGPEKIVTSVRRLNPKSFIYQRHNVCLRTASSHDRHWCFVLVIQMFSPWPQPWMTS